MKLVRPSKGVITSGWGRRSGGIGSTFHLGLDFGWGNGWDIYAAATGTVKFVGWRSGYGNLTIIRHGLGYKTRYAHQSSFLVHKGQKVTAGQRIGIKGNTGTSAGAHLHFELRLFGVAIDPTNKFTATAGDNVTPITEEELELMATGVAYKQAGQNDVFWQEKPGTPLVRLNAPTWVALKDNGMVLRELSAADMSALAKQCGYLPRPQGNSARGVAYRDSDTGAVYWQEKPGAHLVHITSVEWDAYRQNGLVFAEYTSAELAPLLKGTA